ncbi:MAG: dihydroorotate dehydrogenase-like protein [Gemmataceae bacterium]
MIDLTTHYLGLKLRNPLVCSSSPLCQDLESIQRMEEAGAGAVVLHSLFEEQIELESLDLNHYLESPGEHYAESLSYFPDMGSYNLGPEGYLEHVREAKALVKIPIIGSLNGHTRGGWIHYAKLIEQAGADALELNVYDIPTDPARTSAEVEDGLVALVQEVVGEVKIPLAVKLSPFYTAPAALAKRLDQAGAKALVLFNRFYQPDFDLERLEVVPSLWLSTADELRLRLHWIAILHGHVHADLAVTGGVHTSHDVLKALMAGANVAMLTSALLRHGIEHLQAVLHGLREWMEDHEYSSVKMMRGSMSFRSVANPAAFERANYLKVLRSHSLFPSEG